MATDPDTLAKLKKEQASGRSADRPDLFSPANLVTAPGGHGTEYGVPIPTLSSASEAQGFIDARLAEGADYIKIVLEDGSELGRSLPTLDEATLRAAIEAAHRRGVLAVVHVGDYEFARMAIRAGADGLAHTFAERLPDQDYGALVANAGVFVVPTLTVLESASGVAGGATLVNDPVLGPRLSPHEIAGLLQRFPPPAGSTMSIQNALASVRAVHDAGGVILAGTDAPNPGTALGVSLHRELQLLVRAGLTPMEALVAATSAPADAFRLPGRGRIAEGRRADVVLVEGDPTTDILATRNIVGIWKEGRRLKIELALEQARDARAR